MIRQLIRKGEVDELQLHVVPLLLGDGKPLFEPAPVPCRYWNWIG